VRSPASLLFWMIVLAVIAAVAQGARELDWSWPRLPSPGFSRADIPPAAGAALTGRARVIDGDSLEIFGERIRLFGIDAPESRQECRDASGRLYRCGRTAARALLAATAGRTVTCTPVDHDRYDRDVALCAAGGRDLGELLVRAGHAVELAQYSRGRYAAAEREARAARRGVWAGTFDAPADWRRRHGR
jgi:endonuclease YncB( thermonuclease family)